MRLLLVMLLALFSTAVAASTNDYLNISKLHRAALSQHIYISDMDQYGVVDKWVPSLVGDCEDYAMYMQIKLREHGYASDLWITRTEQNELHVVLVVVVLGTNYVVDNRFAVVYPQDFSGYQWIVAVKKYNAKNATRLAKVD